MNTYLQLRYNFPLWFQALFLSFYICFIRKKTITGFYKNLYYVHFIRIQEFLYIKFHILVKLENFWENLFSLSLFMQKSFSSGYPNKFRPKDWQRKKSQIRDLRSNNLFPISNITSNLVLALPTSRGSPGKISMKGQGACSWNLLFPLFFVETRRKARNAFLFYIHLHNKRPFENFSSYLVFNYHFISTNLIRITHKKKS